MSSFSITTTLLELYDVESEHSDQYFIHNTTLVFTLLHQLEQKKQLRQLIRSPLIQRDRSSMANISKLLGGNYFRRAYRMTPAKFENLVSLIGPFLPSKEGIGPNGPIPIELEISASIRYFAGASVYDLMASHGISHSRLFEAIWRVVYAINCCPDLKIEFPKKHSDQIAIAQRFQQRSAVEFNNCAGCIDGILIWTEKPMEPEMKAMKTGSKRFFCGRKGKFGMNMQGVCDGDGKFLCVWVLHPASSSDYISFIRSQFYQLIKTPGFLADGLVIYGDNAYVCTEYMVTPYKSVRSGSKDDYNFFHSQLRITIERAFGMLVKRWSILRSALPSRMGLQKQIALTMALCCLHNFCLETNGDDVLNKLTNRRRNITLSHEDRDIPLDLIGSGDHFDDVTEDDLKDIQKSKIRYDMRQQVIKSKKKRVVYPKINKTNNS